MATDDLNRELNESIAYFEQILDVLPGEKTALEFLCVACSQLGDMEKFLKYAIALTEVVLKEENAEGAADLIEKLSACDDPRAKEAVLKLQVLAAPRPVLKYESSGERVSSSSPMIAAMAETALLDRLVADGVLDRSQIQLAYDQLGSLPTAAGDFLISALLILEKENLPGVANAVAAVADAALAPPIPLEMFELDRELTKALPERLIKVRGAVPFAKLGSEWAVAVLNPLDSELKEEIATELEAKCHFFLLSPLSVDAVMKKLFEDSAEAPAAAPSKPTPIPVAPAAPAAPPPAPESAPASEPEAPAASDPGRPRPKIGIRRPGR